MIRNLAAALCTTTYIVAPATPAQAQTREYNIPAGSLKAALDRYARQSGRQVIYKSDEVRSARSPGARGTMSAEAALAAILSGSGFMAQADRSGAVAIAVDPRLRPQEETASGEGGAGRGEANDARSDDIVVTGSSIRGRAPAGSHVITLDQKYIERSGFANVPDLLKTLPQNAGGGPSEDWTPPIGERSVGNLGFGSALNLRGLGVGATLVLVNGRRQAAASLSASFVDVSSIPLSAVDRIEILPEGASAIYGSDAIGGVVNIILKKDFGGAETSLHFGDYDGRTQEVSVSQLFGLHWTGGSGFVGGQYVRRGAIRNGEIHRDFGDWRARGGNDLRGIDSLSGNIYDLDTFEPAFAPTDDGDLSHPGQNDFVRIGQPGNIGARTGRFDDDALLPDRKEYAVFYDIRQDATPDITLFSSGRFSYRPLFAPSSAEIAIDIGPENPYYLDVFGDRRRYFIFSQDLQVGAKAAGYEIGADVKNYTYSATVGATARLGRWRIEAQADYAREELRARSRVIDTDAIIEAISQIDTPISSYDPAVDPPFNVYGDGTANGPAAWAAVTNIDNYWSDSEVRAIGLKADGPLLRLPAGDVRIAVGVDHREESLNGQRFAVTANRVRRSRKVDALYGEISAPVVAPNSNFPLIRELRLSAALRYERNSDAGSASVPKIGIEWTPFIGIRLRGNLQSSFRAARLVDYDGTEFYQSDELNRAVDNPDAAHRAYVLFSGGANPDLRPERAFLHARGGFKSALDKRLANCRYIFSDTLQGPHRHAAQQCLFSRYRMGRLF